MSKNKIIRADEFVNNPKLEVGISAYITNPIARTRFFADVSAAFEKDPKIRTAIQTEHGRASATVAIKAAAAIGLSLNPVNKEAYLSVFKNGKKSQSAGHDVYDVAFVIQRDGHIKKALEKGSISFLTSGLVFKNDKVIFKSTMDGDVFEVEQDLDDRGDFRGAYSWLITKDGIKSAWYMSRKDIEKHRETWHSQKYNGKYIKSMWWDDATMPAMGEKTCIAKLCEKNKIPAGIIPEEIQTEFDNLGVQISSNPDREVSNADAIAEDMQAETTRDDDGRDPF